MKGTANYFRCFVWSCLLIVCYATAPAQHAPKREMRAVWIATVANIDWPSAPGLSVFRQKSEFIRLLDQLQQVGINAVVVQIRPAADAFYPSALEPWSYWLTGRQGQAPDPYYDPLQFMIEAAHQRGMAFHAWCNPYRAVFNVYKEDELAKGSPVRMHPEWFVRYGTKKYFNPGLPEVRQYLVKVVRDIVNRYDVDAIHFDDYFYPYRIAGKPFPDAAAFQRYGHGLSRDAWRRHNVDTIIQMLSVAIKSVKPWVQFGISPFGVWRNQDQDPEGSDTRAGQTNYDDLYANVLLWLKEGWIDYVCPQIYWDFDQPAVPYGTLLDWWAAHAYGRQLYIGQGLYRVGGRGGWSRADQMPRQLAANRSYPAVQGSIYYSASIFYKNPLGINDSLSQHYYRYPALLPRLPWLDSIPPAAPQPEGILKTARGYLIQWRDRDTTEQTTRFVLYRFPAADPVDRTQPAHILAIVNKSFSKNPRYLQSYVDTSAVAGQSYIYQITALDRLHNESDVRGSLQMSAAQARVPKALYQGP